jgi:cytochrome c biogenesis protein CcdA
MRLPLFSCLGFVSQRLIVSFFVQQTGCKSRLPENRKDSSIMLRIYLIFLCCLSFLALPQHALSQTMSETSPQQKEQPKIKSKGYYNHSQLGFLTGSVSVPPWWGIGPTLRMTHLSLQSTNGYRWKPWLATGLGVGLSLYPQGTLLPVFAEVRSDLLKRALTPHFYAQAGYSFALKSTSDNDWRREHRVKGGIMLDVGTGIKINTRSGFGYTFTAGYRVQQSEESYLVNSDTRIEQLNVYQRISLQAGIMF